MPIENRYCDSHVCVDEYFLFGWRFWSLFSSVSTMRSHVSIGRISIYIWRNSMPNSNEKPPILIQWDLWSTENSIESVGKLMLKIEDRKLKNELFMQIHIFHLKCRMTNRKYRQTNPFLEAVYNSSSIVYCSKTCFTIASDARSDIFHWANNEQCTLRIRQPKKQRKKDWFDFILNCIRYALKSYMWCYSLFHCVNTSPNDENWEPRIEK